jgi:hypothetical protein
MGGTEVDDLGGVGVAHRHPEAVDEQRAVLAHHGAAARSGTATTSAAFGDLPVPKSI